jgi:NAD-dependent SIR2 family protein deacetylase
MTVGRVLLTLLNGARRIAVITGAGCSTGSGIGAHADPAATLDLGGFRVPACLGCGGRLKPDVVFYGGSVPPERVAAAYGLIESADAVLVVGSSLMVFSSFRFCHRARELGIPLIAVNRGVTRADAWLAGKVEADCAEVPAALVAALGGSLAPAGRARA